ncbi:hypothetical protein DCAR_0101117 [Daucus carota subsp. sativus]|uniref:SKP1 component POZ domain-containing protein n=1 Tax=Daucus carota subsp. sativus TaxID=79200 RepID=A0AAF1AGB4_DAUCS|nr:hypothetical protein DCAR_0101117 [Daucus carota subsp. sativus]
MANEIEINNSMSKVPKELDKQELLQEKDKCVWIQTVDGGTVQVEQQILQLSPELWLQIKSGVGLMKSKPLLAPPKVQVAALTSVVEYCRFHRVPDRSDKERKLFADKFLKKDLDSLCLLTHAARYLGLECLCDKLCEAIARHISNSSSQEKHDIYRYATKHAKPETLEDMKNFIGPLQRRLIQKLSVKKEKELAEQENAMKVKAEVEASKCEDKCSVDDLVSFINGGDGDSKKGRTKKKKNHRRKKGPKAVPSVCPTAEPSSSTRDGSLPVEDEFDDGDCDPALKEEIDRLA